MGQASSDLSSSRRDSHESPTMKSANTVAMRKAELRESGSDHASANDDHLKLKFEDVSGDCVALRAKLAAIGATTPSCVYSKKVLGAEADIRHRRLSIGDKHVGRHITAALTDAELGIVIDHDRTGGLDVPVFDGDGARYDFKCVYAEDTGCYRLAGSADYERFMVGNNMVGKELWAFRSPALHIVGNKSAVNDHPDGALGMIILFFDLGTDGSGDDLLHDDDLSIRTITHWLKHCLKYQKATN